MKQLFYVMLLLPALSFAAPCDNNDITATLRSNQLLPKQKVQYIRACLGSVKEEYNAVREEHKRAECAQFAEIKKIPTDSKDRFIAECAKQ